MGVPASLRIEIFCRDLAATADFYERVLSFRVVRDDRPALAYVALERDGIRIGAAAADPGSPVDRRPPFGTEIVLEVDDLTLDVERIRQSGWPLDEPPTLRPWGLADVRLLDPDGYYLRLTDRG